ncbi:MAG: ABC transporter permease [Tissierellia bacterium]|nr:ABC transporter permease [Tissierellia bacterium]
MKIKMKSEYIIAAGIFLLASIIILSVFAQVFTSHNPVETNASNRLMPPDNIHIFGTDQMGRDMFARVLYGGRATIIASFLTMFVTLMIGTILGIIGGYYAGSILDTILLRIIDALMGFPFMILAMLITALFGTGFIHLLIAITSVRWIPFARLARSITLSAKESVGVMAAKVTGASDLRIMKKEILPKILSPAFTLATFELGNLILSISALSFFGLGAKPPTPEWGSILADSKPYFFQSPHLIILPSLFIFSTVLALNLIGEGLRDKFETYEVYDI